MTALLSLLLAVPLFPVPYVATAEELADERAADGDPRFVLNACRDFEERTILPLSRASAFLWVDVKYNGPRRLVSSGATPLRFADDAPAFSVAGKGTSFRVEGKAPGGAPRSVGTVDLNGEPIGRWTFSGVAGVEWTVAFEPGVPPRRGRAESRVCPAGAMATSLGDGTVSLACTSAGLEDGRYEVRDLAGGVRVRGRMMAGQRTGPWWFYDDAGCRARLETFLEGTLAGPTEAWWGPDHDDGENVRYRGFFSDGFAVGPWQYWCGGEQKVARFRLEERAQLAVTFDGCGPPAKAAPKEPRR